MAGPTNNNDYIVLIQNYNVSSDTQSVSIAAPMPESFMFDSTSNYEAPFAQGLFSSDLLRLGAAAMGFKTSTQALTAQLWQGISDTELGLELEFHTENDPLTDVRQPILDLISLTTPIADPTTGLLKSPGPHIDPDQSQDLLKDVYSQAKQLAQKLAEVGSQITGIDLTSTKQGTLNNSSTTTADGSGSTNTTNPAISTAQYWKQRVKNQISIQIGNYMFFDSVVITHVQQTFVANIDAVTGWPHHAKVSVRFKPMFMIAQQDLETIFISPSARQTTTPSYIQGAFSDKFLPQGIFVG